MTPQEQELMALREELDALKREWNTAKRNLLEISLYKPGTLRFGHNIMELGKEGMQVATSGNAVIGIVFREKLAAVPDGTYPYGLIEGEFSGTDGNMRLGVKQSAGDVADTRTITSSTELRQEIRAVEAGGVESRVAALTLVDGTRAEVYLKGALVVEAAALSPAQITSNQDNYDPTGLGVTSILRLSTDASRDITGIVPGVEKRLLMVFNVGSFNIVLKDDTTSTAANRFLLNGDLTLEPDNSVMLWYDDTSSRWRAI